MCPRFCWLNSGNLTWRLFLDESLCRCPGEVQGFESMHEVVNAEPIGPVRNLSRQLGGPPLFRKIGCSIHSHWVNHRKNSWARTLPPTAQAQSKFQASACRQLPYKCKKAKYLLAQGSVLQYLDDVCKFTSAEQPDSTGQERFLEISIKIKLTMS